MQKPRCEKRKIIPAACLVYILLFALCAPAETKPEGDVQNSANLPATDLERIQVGSAAPDFTLESVDGDPVKLSEYRNRKNVILVFYRGYW